MSTQEDIRVAVITGASSGIGLALTQHLLSKATPTWHVVLADVNPPPSSAGLSPIRTRFIQTNVAEWTSQSACFRQAFSWHSRLDFAALNAGIDDRDDIFNTIDFSLSLRDGPRKPNMQTFKVNLSGVYYGIKLAAHYLSASPEAIKPTSKGQERGVITLTASSAGLYPNAAIPIYSATKEALISLTRSLAPKAAENRIRINALCPAIVATGLAPPGLMDAVPQEGVTPMKTIMRAFEEMTDANRGPEGKGRNGGVVEANVAGLHWRENDGWKMGTDSQSSFYRKGNTKEVWSSIYKERNMKWAMMDWEKPEKHDASRKSML